MNAQREFSDGEVVPGTRYRVVSLIGSGGMGSVYEVSHEELGKRFVLKALLRSLTNRDDLVHRLRNEWRALGRLEHPNIVSVTDAGVTDTGVPFYVMERLHGETLATRLRRERRLPVAVALGVAADVLDGLSAAHRIDIVHRDVKPPNVFIVAATGTAKLLDFGIAKMLDPKASQITGRGVAIGTPRYMAPEQAMGGTVDSRTDLYATGLILFEMIAGTGPFDGARDANELFLAHLAKDAPPISTAAPGVPRELDVLLSRLLAKKPEERPSDARAVAAELRALAARIDSSGLAGRAPPRDDRTVPGGPFDTLEAAPTVPSDRPSARRSPLDDTTRTGSGPTGGAGENAATTEVDGDLPTSTHGGGGGERTLRLDVAESSEAPTRTAAPLPANETPPPVEPSAVRPPGARAPVFVGAAVALLGAALVLVPRFRGADHAPPRDVASAAAGAAPAVAVEPVPAPETSPSDSPGSAFVTMPAAGRPPLPSRSAARALVRPLPALAPPSVRAELPSPGLAEAVKPSNGLARSAPVTPTGGARPTVRMSKKSPESDVLPSSGL